MFVLLKDGKGGHSENRKGINVGLVFSEGGYAEVEGRVTT